MTRDRHGWIFTKPDGQPCDSWVDDANLARHLDFALRQTQQPEHDHQIRDDQLAAVDSFQYPDACTIQPGCLVNPSTCTPGV